MGFFSGIGGALSGLAAANPVGMLGTGIAMGGDILNYFGNEADRRSAEAMNATNNAQSMSLAQQNMALEREFAQNGISWKIADAAKHGISPLAAIGAVGPSYNPVSAVFNSVPTTSSAGNSYRAFADLSQNISRSLLATKTPAERTAETLDLIRRQKENDLLDVQYRLARVQLAKSSSPGIPLAYREALNRDGSISIVPTEDSAQVSHGQFLGPIKWSLDNQYIPALQNTGRHMLDVDQTPYPQGGISADWVR